MLLLNYWRDLSKGRHVFTLSFPLAPAVVKDCPITILPNYHSSFFAGFDGFDMGLQRFPQHLLPEIRWKKML